MTAALIPETATVPDVDLDPAIHESLQPPCEARLVSNCPVHGLHIDACDEPAEWVLRGHEHDGPALVCALHLAIAHRGLLSCSVCHQQYGPNDLTAERI